MRLLCLLVVGGFIAGCDRAPAAPAVVRAPAKAHVAEVFDLPGEDGRVYVIDSPSVVENVKCFLHVRRDGGSTMACTPPRIDPPAMEPMQR